MAFSESFWEIVGKTYLVAGFLVAGFIAIRGMKWRRTPTNALLWDRRDNVRNGLFLFQSILLFWPIAFLIEVLLWPLVLLFLWTSQVDDDDQETN